MPRKKGLHSLRSCRRWLDIFLLIFIVLVLCYLFNPFLNSLGEKLDENFFRIPFWIYLSVNALSTVPVCFVLIRLGGFRIQDLWTITSLRFPPLWIATLIGAFLYFLITPLQGILAEPEDFVSKLPYILIGFAPIVPGIIITSFLNFLSSNYKKQYLFPKRASSSFSSIASLQSFIEHPDALIKWLHQEIPIQKPGEDLFDFSVVARRIARLLQEKPLKTIGLVGPYGCGKSSILNLIEYYLHNYSQENEDKALFNPKDIIISKTSGWGFKGGAAAENILHAIIQELSKHVDCLGLVSVPSQYRSAFSNTGYAWCRILAILLQPSHNPIGLLQKIDGVLICIRKRLVIFLEDLDRNIEDEVFWNEILSLLDRLKGLENISFVLAIGQEPKTVGVLMRIAEHTETIPPLPRRQMIDLLSSFRNFCFEKFPEDVDLLSKEEREDNIGIRPHKVDHLAELMGVDLLYPIGAIAKILINPRLTKAALRRVW